MIVPSNTRSVSGSDIVRGRVRAKIGRGTNLWPASRIVCLSLARMKLQPLDIWGNECPKAVCRCIEHPEPNDAQRNN